MSRVATIPARGQLPAAQLLARISTPSDRSADEINSNFPSVVLVHPIWTDSFFFFPQYDDPEWYENYNLISFDARGHGATETAPLPDGTTFSLSDSADDMHVALEELGVKLAHVVGVSVGAMTALRYAQKYPHHTSSLTMVSPPLTPEPAAWTFAYAECEELLRKAIASEDIEALEDMTTASWGWCIGNYNLQSVKDLKRRFIDHQATKLLQGKLKQYVPYISSQMACRSDLLTKAELKILTCPVLIIQSDEDAEEDMRGTYGNLIRALNDNAEDRQKGLAPCRPPAMLEVVQDVPRWMTMTHPHVVDPVILEQVELASAQQDVTPSTPVTPHSVSTWQLQTPLSPTYSTFSRDSRASFSSLSLRSARRTSSSPREMTGFSIPPPPKTAPGVLTLGQVLDGEKAADGPMAVEVVVTVDQE